MAFHFADGERLQGQSVNVVENWTLIFFFHAVLNSRRESVILLPEHLQWFFQIRLLHFSPAAHSAKPSTSVSLICQYANCSAYWLPEKLVLAGRVVLLTGWSMIPPLADTYTFHSTCPYPRRFQKEEKNSFKKNTSCEEMKSMASNNE